MTYVPICNLITVQHTVHEGLVFTSPWPHFYLTLNTFLPRTVTFVPSLLTCCRVNSIKCTYYQNYTNMYPHMQFGHVMWTTKLHIIKIEITSAIFQSYFFNEILITYILPSTKMKMTSSHFYGFQNYHSLFESDNQHLFNMWHCTHFCLTLER